MAVASSPLGALSTHMDVFEFQRQSRGTIFFLETVSGVFVIVFHNVCFWRMGFIYLWIQALVGIVLIDPFFLSEIMTDHATESMDPTIIDFLVFVEMRK